MEKTIPTKEVGKRFQRLFTTLNLEQKECAAWLRVTPPTIRSWIRTEPKLLENHRKIMIDSGINPLYLDGLGEMTLPGVSMDNAIDNIKERIGHAA
jgi:hypothetical protein